MPEGRGTGGEKVAGSPCCEEDGGLRCAGFGGSFGFPPHLAGFEFVMTAFLFSCSYATCAVPEAYRAVFKGSEDVVASTEGWEPGSLNLAQGFSMKFRTPLVHADVTRLLIDFEKDGDERWSRFSDKLPEATKVKLMDRHERPYRAALRQRIAEDLRRHESVLHVMVHTDAEADGSVVIETPRGDLMGEKYATAWRARLAAADLTVRHVAGVEGTALGQAMCRSFPGETYSQLRLKVALSFFLEGKPWRWETLKRRLLETLAPAADEVTASRASEGV